ncbi:MAG TPA: YdcF family protein [Anaerolineae bacterium]|nr:YdcF family protein [Anaerolineae bacterium]
MNRSVGTSCRPTFAAKLASGLAAAAALLAAMPMVLPLAARWLDVGQRVPPADCAFVLPGDANTRPFFTAALFHRRLVRRVLVTTVKPGLRQLQGIAPPAHEVIIGILEHQRVPRTAVMVLEKQSTSTWEDLEALARYLGDHPRQHVLVVTSDYHSRRTRWTVARALGPLARQCTVVSAPTDLFPMGRWWQSAEGFRLITSEYLKLTYYWFRYGRGLWWCGGGVLVVTAVWIHRRRRR